jgi:hypothetical protein
MFLQILKYREPSVLYREAQLVGRHRDMPETLASGYYRYEVLASGFLR